LAFDSYYIDVMGMSPLHKTQEKYNEGTELERRRVDEVGEKGPQEATQEPQHP
jgi:hypothetical protein